jgi:selenocysteine lyase/cysteine desulfurase
LAHGLAALDGVHVLTDRGGDGRSGIVTFTIDGVTPAVLAEQLTAEAFVCAARGGGVRISPHGYNTEDEIDALVGAAADQQDRQAEGHRTA